MDFDLGASIQNLMNLLIEYVPMIIGAIIVLIVGFWIANKLTSLFAGIMRKNNLDPGLQSFLSSLISATLKILVILTAASTLGIQTSSFVALLAAAGFAIGMAMQGTLGHFAAGVMVLIFKPYKVGDLVDLQGQVGHVEEIQVFNTVLNTLDNKRVIIPNGIATGGIMTNLSTLGKLRVDLQVAMAYEEDFDKVQGIIMKALDTVKDRLPDTPTVEIDHFDANNIVIDVRPYATPEKYWDVYFGTYKAVKKAFGEAGITVAYPRMKVDMVK